MSRSSRKPAAAAAKAGFEIVSPSAEATEALGEALGMRAWPGLVLALHGELGAGKTTFMRGFVAGAGGSADAVKSPTFVLQREYAARVPVIHVDGYRLSGAAEAAFLDMELIFSADKVTAVEWPDRFGELLPVARIDITFSHQSTHRRKIRMSGSAEKEQACVAALAAQPPAPPVKEAD